MTLAVKKEMSENYGESIRKMAFIISSLAGEFVLLINIATNQAFNFHWF